MAHTQDDRHIAITTPLGKDVLLLKRVSGHEAMSRPFSYELELLSEKNPAINFNDIVGKNVTIKVKHADGNRFFNGIVRRFSQGAGEPSFASYRAELVPWLWLLTQTADCRIFQNMTVPDIIQKIFKDLGFTDFKLNLAGRFSRASTASSTGRPTSTSSAVSWSSTASFISSSMRTASTRWCWATRRRGPRLRPRAASSSRDQSAQS